MLAGLLHLNSHSIEFVFKWVLPQLNELSCNNLFPFSYNMSTTNKTRGQHEKIKPTRLNHRDNKAMQYELFTLFKG